MGSYKQYPPRCVSLNHNYVCVRACVRACVRVYVHVCVRIKTNSCVRYSCAYFGDEINKRNLHRIGSWIERSILNDAAPSYYLCAGTRVDRLYRNTTLAVGVRRIPK